MADKTTMLISPSFGEFLFDAVLNTEHNREVTVTNHPVQYGAEISDHSFIEPETVNLQIGMSDAMAEIGQEAHSVNAYAQLVQMMEARELITLVTRLGTYRDMLIVSMSAPDEFSVMNGVKAQIGLKHINIVTSAVVLIQNKVSSSKGGYKQPEEEEKTPDPEAEDKDWNKSILKIFSDLFNGASEASSTMSSSGMKMTWDEYKSNQLSESAKYTEERMGGREAVDREIQKEISALNNVVTERSVGSTYVGLYGIYIRTADGWRLKARK